MALFSKDTAKDPFGFLGMKPPVIPHRSAEGSPGGYSVGNDITAQPKGRTEDFTDQPGLNPIKRHSAKSEDDRGYLAEKLTEQKSELYKSRAERPHNQPDSKISLDLESRSGDKYADGIDYSDSKRTIETKYDQTKYTGTTPPTADSGKSTQVLQEFKKNYDDALTKLNVNRETAILNNTKEQSVLSMLASGKTGMLSSITHTKAVDNTPEAEKEYYENLGKRYEKRYDTHRYHLNKKKVPNYSSDDQSLRIDGYNKKTVSDNNVINQFKFRTEDLIPMYFHDLVNKKYIPFRSFINSVSEGSNATWAETTYLGRADKVFVYSGFTRTMTVDFTVQAFSIEELHPMWQRINYLVGLTKPAAYTGEAGITSSTSSFIIPPFVKFRLGDMYRNQPVIITDVATTVPPEASWELVSNEHGNENNYEYLNKTIVRKNVRSAQYPTSVTMGVSMTLLEKRAPETIARHFGDSTAESIHTAEDNSLPRGDFNHQLIHYEEDGDQVSPELEVPSTDSPTAEEVENEKRKSATEAAQDNWNSNLGFFKNLKK